MKDNVLFVKENTLFSRKYHECSQLRNSLNWIYWGGISQSATDTFATGTVITAYALLLGAGDFAVGMLGAVPFIGNLSHVLAAWFLEKGCSVKKLSIFASFLSRPFYLLAACLAFFSHTSWAVPALVLFLSLVYFIGNIAGGAWRPWMKNLVPDRIMASFFSTRFKGMMVARIACFLFCGLFLEYYRRYNAVHEIYSYFYLLLITFVISVFTAYTFTQIQDVPVASFSTLAFVKKIKLCFRKKEFVRLMSALGFLNFTVNFFTPFLAVFLLQKLKLSTPEVVFLTVFSQVVYTGIIKKIGKLSDKTGLPLMMVLLLPSYCLVLAVFAFLCTVSVADTVIWTALILAHIFLGIGQAAVTLGSNNLSLLFIPQKNATVYLAVNSVLIAVCGAIGSIVGGGGMVMSESVSEYFNFANGKWYSLFFVTAVLFLLMIFQFKNLKKIT